MKKVCECRISKKEVIQNIKKNIYDKDDWMNVDNIYVGYVDNKKFSVSYKRAVDIDKDLLKMIDFSPTIIKGEVKEISSEVYIEYIYTKKTSVMLLTIGSDILAIFPFLSAILGAYKNIGDAIISLAGAICIFGVSYLIMTVKKSEKEKLVDFLDVVRQ